MVKEKLKQYYMDLHIHIGRTLSGKPVKITASKDLTLSKVLEESLNRKGLHIIGVIDAHSPEVLEEMADMILHGEAEEMVGGGIRYKEQITLICGTEIEIYDERCQGPIHVLCYLPTLQTMEIFSQWCSERMKNIQLSSQRIYATGLEVQAMVKSLGGLFIPAHIFTPFKSMYGKGVHKSLEEVFDPSLIDGVELGLSSDTNMAKDLPELAPYTFLTNSDAHSSGKIAREHQIVRLMEPTFHEISLALEEKGGRQIVKNIGLHPKLGKYYETVCRKCLLPLKDGKCIAGHDSGFIRGVSDKVRELAALQKKGLSRSIDHAANYKIGIKSRPPYVHQAPLSFIPGCGPKTVEKLLNALGTEMKVIHEAEEEELSKVISKQIAKKIIQAREGKVDIQQGGGGRYGKIK